jgi:N-acetylmuramoyl-L-alanine amidase
MKIKTIKRNTIFFFLTLLFLIPSNLHSQQVTGLSGWNLFIDPGHSQNENMGIYNYSEARKVLRVGLALRQMLLDWTDIDTVYMSRTDDQQSVSISQRYTMANNLGAAWFHSIHSDAASPSANSILLLISDNCASATLKICSSRWGILTINMADFMSDILSRSYRIPTRGTWGDRSFGLQMGTSYGSSGVGVLRETNMPATLSEGGFHTNPRQNQLNMNEKWKRLEAYSLYLAILEYHNITRPYVGIVTGIISDIESGQPINGAIVTVDGQTDTTDTWESLFYQYSNDPELLRNGFYYFEDVSSGTHQLSVQTPGYESLTVNVTPLDTFFTFKDIQLISQVPPKVLSTVPAENDSLYPGVESLIINFSRPMDKTSLESNISFNPPVSVTYTWSNMDKTVTINTTNMNFNTVYDVTISGDAIGKYGHLFDGNGDGIGGDPLTFSIKTKVPDVSAPLVVDVYPEMDATNIELRPVINFAFDERINTTTLSGKFSVVRNSTQTNAAGILRHYLVNNRSALNFFVTTPLVENETYTIQLLPGVEDIFGNPITTQVDFTFTTGNSNYTLRTSIDHFESGIGSWFQPTASGSTVGVINELTKISLSTSVINLNTQSTRSMMLEYGWDTNASNWLIREYFTPVQPQFGATGLMQVFLFGDGSNNKFRFAVREVTTNTFEVSPWYDVDWIGWRLVSWDLAEGQTGTWIGNGVLEPPLRFDSFQMTYSPGNENIGILYFDDVRIATFDPVGVELEDDNIPFAYNLEQNYPNPFNPSTSIRFSVPEAAFVKVIITDVLGREVATLINEELNSGNYSLTFNASELSSGIYLYTLKAGNHIQTKKMMLLK